MAFEFCSQRSLSCETDSVKTCGQGVEGATHFIQTDTFGSSSVIPSPSAYSQIGRLFSYKDIVFYSDASPTFQILFRNPANNDRTMYLDKFICGITLSPQAQIPMHYECQLITHIHRDLTINNLGIAVPTTPLNVGFSGASSTIEVRAFVNTNFVLFKNLFINAQLNEMSTVNFKGRIILPPGHDLIFTFAANRIESANIILEQAFTIMYYEL